MSATPYVQPSDAPRSRSMPATWSTEPAMHNADTTMAGTAWARRVGQAPITATSGSCMSVANGVNTNPMAARCGSLLWSTNRASATRLRASPAMRPVVEGQDEPDDDVDGGDDADAHCADSSAGTTEPPPRAPRRDRRAVACADPARAAGAPDCCHPEGRRRSHRHRLHRCRGCRGAGTVLDGAVVRVVPVEAVHRLLPERAVAAICQNALTAATLIISQ